MTAVAGKSSTALKYRSDVPVADAIDFARAHCPEGRGVESPAQTRSRHTKVFPSLILRARV